MKSFLLALAVIFSSVVHAETPGKKDAVLSDELDSEQGKFAVSVAKDRKKVEVKKIGGTDRTPPYLRVRVLREHDRPLELHLKTVERVDSPLAYSGTLPQPWQDSYVGLEVDFSFDKKTWKRLGKTLNKLLP